MGMPTATVRLSGPEDSRFVQAAIGTGPVDAVYKAIDEIVGESNVLLEFSVHAVTEGIDAQGEVTVRIQGEDAPVAPNAQRETSRLRTYGGYGADTDIIVASAKAYLSALNKLLAEGGDRGEVAAAARVGAAAKAEPTIPVEVSK